MLKYTVEMNALSVEQLLNDPHIQVSWLFRTDVLTKSSFSPVYRLHKQKTRWLPTETKALVKCTQDNFLQLQITSYVSTALCPTNIFTYNY